MLYDVCYFPKTIDENYKENLGFPGQYPFTRGIHPNLYRGRLWTIANLWIWDS